jgi:hypothetical protein
MIKEQEYQTITNALGVEIKGLTVRMVTKVGDRPIYPEQQVCAEQVVEILHEGTNHPVLLAETQQGKTDTCIYVANLLINHQDYGWANRKIDYDVYFITNVSNVALNEQTNERIAESKLDSIYKRKIHCLHHAQYRNPQRAKYGSEKTLAEIEADVKNNPDKMFLLFIDEAHVAQEADKPYDKFIKRFGIDYGKPVFKNKYKNVYAVSVSATPFAHATQQRLKKGGVEFARLIKNKQYYSLEHMYNAQRIKEAEEPFEKKGGKWALSEWTIDRLNEFKKIIKNNHGNLVFRVSDGDKAVLLKKYIKNNYNFGCEIFATTKHKTKTINSLPNYLKDVPKDESECTVLIIINAMRVGMSVDTTRNIRMWIDSPKSAGDTTIQSIGRCLGYDDNKFAEKNNLSVHSKFDDVFPVYCDMREIELAIDFYNKFNKSCVIDDSFPIPSGNNNSASHRYKKNGNAYIWMADSTDANRAKGELDNLVNSIFPKMQSFNDVYSRGANVGQKKYTTGKTRVLQSTMSENAVNELALDLLNHNTRTNMIDTDSQGNRIVRIFHVDAPAKEANIIKQFNKDSISFKKIGTTIQECIDKQKENWNMLMEAMPQLEGRFIYCFTPEEYNLLETEELLAHYKINGQIITPPTTAKVIELEPKVSEKSTFNRAISEGY